MSTRFFPAALTTGMAGSSIDPDLAASLTVRDRRHARAEARGRGIASFSTLLCERGGQSVETQPAGAWRRLRRALKRLSAS
jgi:hypothetical protein